MAERRGVDRALSVCRPSADAYREVFVEPVQFAGHQRERRPDQSSGERPRRRI
jgi:hypothetical protein